MIKKIMSNERSNAMKWGSNWIQNELFIRKFWAKNVVQTSFNCWKTFLAIGSKSGRNLIVGHEMVVRLSSQPLDQTRIQYGAMDQTWKLTIVAGTIWAIRSTQA